LSAELTCTYTDRRVGARRLLILGNLVLIEAQGVKLEMLGNYWEHF